MQDDIAACSEKVNYSLDISDDVCPMTFVKVKLLIERMATGEVAEIYIKGSEPLINIPKSINSLGHEIIFMERLSEVGLDQVSRLVFVKKRTI